MAASSEVQDHDAVSEGSLDNLKGSNRGQGNGVSCGLGPCRPRWLQFFAKPIYFMIILNIYCFVEGTIVSGKNIISWFHNGITSWVFNRVTVCGFIVAIKKIQVFSSAAWNDDKYIRFYRTSDGYFYKLFWWKQP